jgi:signal transduction histidine kinase
MAPLHRFALAQPEVTSCPGGIAGGARPLQHAGMPRAHSLLSHRSGLSLRERLRTLLHPFNLAGLFTWGAVALSMRWMHAESQAVAWTLLVAYLLALLANDLLRDRYPHTATALLWLEAVVALLLVWLDPGIGTAQVLLVVWTAQIAAAWEPRRALLAVLLADAVVYAILVAAGQRSPLVIVAMYAGFQAFAALCAFYAVAAERARDQLVRVNADLLATRALLADSARDAERLRVARELHDVAGHKLTALTLNLRALAADPTLADKRELKVAQQMSAELLGDIRSVVQALRDTSGLDLGTALRALAAPMPRPLLQLAIDDDVHINDPVVAEAVLRLVQEALTNSARHAEAEVVRVRLQRDGDRLAINVEDDGFLHGAIREGNGLSGMRERLVAAGGTLALSTTARGALRIEASLPL